MSPAATTLPRGPLQGIRVLDLSAVVAGPLTAVLLADQGADVIKVERLAGDIQRHVGSSRSGMSGNFHMLNRGKRSIAIDLKRDRGRRIVEELADRSDIVIQNFRPGVVERLGIGYEQLSRRNPRLVYVSLSGFGPDGPHAGRRAYDPIIQARSGLAAAQGASAGDGPQQVNQLLADKITAYAASQAATAALVARQQTGRGQHVTLAMLDSVVCFLWPDAAADRILLGEEIDERPPIGAAGHLARYRDGWATTMTLSDAEYRGLCEVYELDRSITEDSRFATVPGRQRFRHEYREMLDREAAARAGELDLDDAEQRFEAAHVPFGRVQAIADVPDDPQIRHNRLFRELEHPVAGRLRETRPAPVFSETPLRPAAPAPLLGEHTAEILSEIGLGELVSGLMADGVVGSETPDPVP